MRHEQACLGMFVRLLSDWHGIPKGTVGSIDTVETGADGAWSFTVFWEPHRPLPSIRPGRTRTRTGFQSGSLGLRLWEEDLPRFEVINHEQKDVATLHVGPPPDTESTPLCLFSAQDAEQLTLPFGDREFIEEDQPQLAFASAGADFR
jgi:hypothetical protein